MVLEVAFHKWYFILGEPSGGTGGNQFSMHLLISYSGLSESQRQAWLGNRHPFCHQLGPVGPLFVSPG